MCLSCPLGSVLAKNVFPVFSWQNVRLTLDRTTWEYGKSCINILALAIVWRGVAIPELWETLDKKGTPTQANE